MVHSAVLHYQSFLSFILIDDSLFRRLSVTWYGFKDVGQLNTAPTERAVSVACMPLSDEARKSDGKAHGDRNLFFFWLWIMGSELTVCLALYKYPTPSPRPPLSPRSTLPLVLSIGHDKKDILPHSIFVRLVFHLSWTNPTMTSHTAPPGGLGRYGYGPAIIGPRT